MTTYRFKTKPDEHQLVCLKTALKKERFGIFFQQRGGKTKVAIDFCGAKAISDNARKVLIVCPLSVRTEWQSQIEEHLGYEYDFYLYPKTEKKRVTLLNATIKTDKLTFIVINYDLISKQKELLLKWKPDIIILDESHLIKNHASKRSKAAWSLTKKSKYVLLLTGTPVPKRWYDIFGQFRALDDQIFNTWAKFKRKYAIMGGYLGKEIVGCTDYDKIADIIGENSMRVLRKDIFEEPKVESILLTVDLEPNTRRVYDSLRKTCIADLAKEKRITADMAITRSIRLRQLCGGFVTTDEGDVEQISTAKLDLLADLVETRVEGSEQVVIFYVYTPEGKAIRDMLIKKKIEHGVINGGVSEEMRKHYRDLFQDEKLDVMLIQIATGAMGISLDKAHINIFYSLDFSLSNFQQARDRIMGRNQKDDVTNYFIAASKTIDQRIMKTLKNDEDISDMVSNKWRWLFEEEE